MLSKCNDKEYIIELLGQFHAFSNLGEVGVSLKLLQYDRDSLFEILRDILETEEKMRNVTTRAMMKIDENRALPLILPLLDDPNPDVRWHICGLLSQCQDDKVFKPLTQRLQDLDPEVRSIATFALGKIGDESVLPALEWTKQNDEGTDFEGRPVSLLAEHSINEIIDRLK